MDLSDYKKEALRSEKPLTEVVFDADLLSAVLATAVHMSNVVDLVKKAAVYGKPFDPKALETALQHVGDLVVRSKHLTRFPADAVPVNVNARIFHAAVGAYGEAGEVLELLLKQMQTGVLDLEGLQEETGDRCWYLALELDEIERVTGVKPEVILRKNIRKLEVRYPEKFTLAASETRDTQAEAAAMKGVDGRAAA